MRLVLLALGVAALSSPSLAAARSVVVVSDLHIGASEPFPWAADFEAFLEAIASEDSVDLVLNGDTFDLSGASELPAVLDANRGWLQAIRRFSRAGNHRVFFVPGHTDLWLDEAEASLEGVTIASSGQWSSDDGAILIEHGSRDREGDLAWERGFYRDREAEFPLVDDVAVLGAGIPFVLAAQPELPPPADLARLVRLSVGRLEWQQFRADLEIDVEPPVWDLETVREAGDAFLVTAAPEGTPLRDLLERALDGGSLGLSGDDLSDETIAAICDYRAAVRRARRRLEKWVTQFEPVGSPGRECPRREDARGAAFQYFWGARDAALRRRLERFEAVGVYVTGHTHVPHRPYTLEREGREVAVIGSGAWRRTVTPASIAARSREEGRTPLALLRGNASALSACYPFVIVEGDAELRYWAKGESGFSIESSCP